MAKRVAIESEAFNRFWAAYPKRVARLDALKAWTQLRPSAALVDAMIDALAWQRQQPAWTRDRGQYVPYPASWLRAGRWMDEQDAPMGPFIWDGPSLWRCPHQPACQEGRWKCVRRTQVEDAKRQESR